MRILDLPSSILCRNHLLGEHCELHAMWIAITEKKKRYSMHPETIRWKGKLMTMYLRHEELVKETNHSGYCHKSPLDKRKQTGESFQDVFVNTSTEQIVILKNKKCDCKLK